MKKLFTAVLIMAMAVSSVAFAGYRAEYQSRFPVRVKVKTEQDLSGKMVTTEEYRLFSNKGFTLGVRISNDYREAYIQYLYHDKPLKFYDGFTCGDGKGVYDLPLWFDPIRSVDNGYVTEIIAATINPTKFKEALIVHAHSLNGGSEVMIASANPAWKAWTEALEDAEKLLADK